MLFLFSSLPSGIYDLLRGGDFSYINKELRSRKLRARRVIFSAMVTDVAMIMILNGSWALR